MKRIAALLFLCSGLAAWAQNPSVVPVPTAPTTCGPVPLFVLTTNGYLYGDNGSGTCQILATPGGSPGGPYLPLAGGTIRGALNGPVVNAVRYAAGAPSSCTTTSGGALTHQADCAFYQAVDAAVSSGNSVDLVFGDGYWNAYVQWVEPTAGFYNVNLIGTSMNGSIIQEEGSIPTQAMLVKTAGSAFFFMRDLKWITNANAGSCFDLTAGLIGGAITNVNCYPGVPTATSGLDHAVQLGSNGNYFLDFVISNLIISPPYGIAQTHAVLVPTGTTSLTGATVSSGGTYGATTYAVGIVNDPNGYCTGTEPTFTPTFTGSAVSGITVTSAGTCSGGLPDLQVIEQYPITYGLKGWISDSKIDYLEPNVGITGAVVVGGANTYYHAHPTAIQYGLWLNNSTAAGNELDGTECDTISSACMQVTGTGGMSIQSTQNYVEQGMPGDVILQFNSGAANVAFTNPGDLCGGYSSPIDYHEFLASTGPVIPGGTNWPSGSTVLGNDRSCTHAGTGTNIDYDPSLLIGGSNSFVSATFDISTGIVATPAVPYILAPSTGTVSHCYFTTTTSDNSTNLVFNVKFNGTNILSGTNATVTAGTSAGTISTFSLTSSTIAVTRGQLWELDISGGTASWTGAVQCY